MTETVKTLNEEFELFFPRSEEHRIYELGRESLINKTEASSQGTICYANMTAAQLTRWKDFLVSKGGGS